MKIRARYLILLFALAITAVCTPGCRRRDHQPSIINPALLDRPAKIRPDYSSTVIPPNIAPLNFTICEDGTEFYVKIYSGSTNGSETGRAEPIKVFSRKPGIVIPLNAWRELLGSTRGRQLYFDVFVKDRAGRWTKFAPIVNNVANENIDGYLVYRKMHPTHIHRYGEIAICCRNLTDYDESLILNNNHLEFRCMNCHTFSRNQPDPMAMGVRNYTKEGDNTLLLKDGKLSKINAKFGYSSWHPNGRLISYSVDDIPMVYHTTRTEVRDTVGRDGLLAYYLVNDKTINTSPQFSKKEKIETWPAWSADGKYLYFCTAPKTWSKATPPHALQLDKIKYDLVRISYDVNKNEWAAPETVLSAEQTGRSAAMPRTSPDGRWLSFCMSDYGFFPSWQQTSDLYLLDLKNAEATGKFDYRRLDINSDRSEAWQSWSSNSRWLAFSSKRDYGVFTRIYFSYVDEQGRVHKPVLLPQKDPEFYDSCLQIYTLPELITGPVEVTQKQLLQLITGPEKIRVDMPVTMATPAPPEYGQPGGEKPWYGQQE